MDELLVSSKPTAAEQETPVIPTPLMPLDQPEGVLK